MAQPIEQLLVDQLATTFSAPLPTLAPDEEAELAALSHLSDDALWTIVREQMPADIDARLQILMDRNNFGTITPTEYAELEQNVERGNRLMLRKAEAAALLTARGHKVTLQQMVG